MGFLGFKDGCGGMQPNRVEFEQEKMEGTTKLEGTSNDALWFVLGRRGLGSGFWSAWVIEWFFFFFNMGFCSSGILVGNGGAVIEVEGKWRRKLEKKKIYIYIYIYITM